MNATSHHLPSAANALTSVSAVRSVGQQRRRRPANVPGRLSAGDVVAVFS